MLLSRKTCFSSDALRPSLVFRISAMRTFVFLVCMVYWPVNSALAQGGAAANQAFTQATAALREGRLDEAAAGFEAITQSAPTFAGAYLNLGLVREEQGRNEEAI